jgi:Na+/melibiose symporter-like transporter
MTAATSVRKTNFFINRNFALLWSGQTVSIIGDYIFSATLILWIGTRIAVGQSWAPLAISGVLIATAIPTLLVGPFAGVFVDRWNKRRTMLVMDFCRAAFSLLLLVLSMSNIASTHFPIMLLAEIYGIVILMTTCTQFFNPASVAMFGSIVVKDDLTRATGRQQATSGLANILGLSLSAPLFFGLGVQWALLINALSFLISFATILFIRIQASETDSKRQTERKNSFIQDFSAGLHFYAHNTALMTLLIATSFFIIGAGIVNTLNFFFITENLHASGAMFSYINAGFGAGAILGAILAIWGSKRLGARNMFWLSLLFTGLLLIFYAQSTSPILAMLIFFLLGIPNAISNAMLNPLLLEVTPGEFIGRVVAVLLPTLTMVRIITMALAGYLDSNVLENFRAGIFGMRFSTINLLFITAGLLTLIGSLYAQFNFKRQVKESMVDAERHAG